MPKKAVIISKILIAVLLFVGLPGFAQKKVTVQANNLALSTILNQVSVNYQVRFAFDDDLLSQIETSVNVTNVELETFITDICTTFGLNFRLIAGTYVLFVDNETKMAEAITATAIKKEQAIDTIANIRPQVREYTLKGLVINRKTREKINYCSVMINGTESTITNEMGFFSKTFEGDNNIELSIKHIGYEAFDTSFVLSSSAMVEIKLDPIPRLVPMNAMGLMRINFFVEMSEAPEMVAFHPSSTLQMPSIESNDLINALITIPGINYLKGVDTGLSIRGGAPSDNLVLIDGIPMIESNHLMGNLSVLNAKYIQQAFVSRGGFGAEYGGRTSGIVDLTGKAGSSERAEIDFTANQLHTNIYVGMPINEKASLSGSFKKSFADVWSNYLTRNFALENKSYFADNQLLNEAYVDFTDVNYSDINLKLSLRPNKRVESSFNLFNSFNNEQRDYRFDMPGEYYQFNQTGSKTLGFSYNLKNQSRNGWLNAFSVAYNNFKSNSVSEYGKSPDIITQPVKPFFDADEIHIRSILSYWKSELNNKYIKHKYGAEYNYNYLNYLYEDHEIKVLGANNYNDSISANRQIVTLSAYYQADLLPLSWLQLRAGLRALYNINNGKFSVQPRYGIEIMPLPKLKVYYSSGRYLQHMYLTYRIDSYHNPSPIWYIPDKDKQYLDAFHHIAGVRYESPKLMLNIEAYSKQNNGKVFYLGQKNTSHTIDIVQYNELIGQELNYGFDFFFQYKSKFLKHLLSYSLSQSLEQIEGVNQSTYFNSFEHQLHRFRLTEIATFRGWTASANWYFSSGMNYLLNSSTVDNLNFGVLPDFMQLDISLVKQIDFRYFYADIGITILNVLNRQNELSRKNIEIPEGLQQHNMQIATTASAFSPLFYVNLRYE